MDWSEIGQNITILASAGALLWGFLNHGWPRLARAWTKRKNKAWIDKTEELIPISGRKNLYKLLDECDQVIKRSQKNDLSGDEDEASGKKEEILFYLRYKVRLYILPDLPEHEDCKLLLLKQNMVQSMFTFELGQCRGLHSGLVDEHKSRRRYIEKWEEVIGSQESKYPVKSQESLSKEDESPIRIIVTSASMPRGYYLWGHFKGEGQEEWGRFPIRKSWVISTSRFDELLPNIPVERIVLRIVQRICALSAIPQLPCDIKKTESNNKDALIVHRTTRGCLFDFTQYIIDVQYFSRLGIICPECTSAIMQKSEEPHGHRRAFLMGLSQWLTDTHEFTSERKSFDRDDEKITE